MKLDATGNISWSKYYDGIDAHAVKVATGGGYVIAGRSSVGAQMARTDAAGNVTITAGTTPGSSGTFTLTFTTVSGAYGTNPPPSRIIPAP